MPPLAADIVGLLYMGTLGRYRMRYGLIPAAIGMLVDVGIWKTTIFLFFPQTILLAITFGISWYVASFILGSRKDVLPDFDMSAVSAAVTRFHPGADQDARDLGKILVKQGA